MIDHIGVQVADVEASLAFYLKAFAPIGMREVMRFPHAGAFVVGLAGADGAPSFWLHQGGGAETRELHLAFRAPDRTAVDAVHGAAAAAGARTKAKVLAEPLAVARNHLVKLTNRLDVGEGREPRHDLWEPRIGERILVLSVGPYPVAGNDREARSRGSRCHQALSHLVSLAVGAEE